MAYNLPNKIEINCKQDLLCCAKYIIAHIPLGNTYSSEIHENYSMCLYMLALSEAGHIKYPTVIKILGNNDPPDFIFNISTQNIIIGFEHTRATKESFIVANKEMQKRDDIRFLESSFYTFRNKLHNKQAFLGLKKDNEELTGSPSFGNAHITNWADFVFAAYKTKSQQFKEFSDKQCNSYELLIEVIIPNLIGNKHDIALNILNEKIKTESGNIPNIFNKLHIFSQNRIILNALGSNEIIEFSRNDITNILK